mmetsp:Transcript_34172/g.80453  ORF Transcript_34172/g.80453 Transcript_34172/m.80453 type:complete len:117 (-) Transcript_34172:1154-1504(-)
MSRPRHCYARFQLSTTDGRSGDRLRQPPLGTVQELQWSPKHFGMVEEGTIERMTTMVRSSLRWKDLCPRRWLSLVVENENQGVVFAKALLLIRGGNCYSQLILSDNSNLLFHAHHY